MLEFVQAGKITRHALNVLPSPCALVDFTIISRARTGGRVKKKLGVTNDGLTCHSITGVEKHQKRSYLALSLPGGKQVSFFYSPTSPVLFRAPGFDPAGPSFLSMFLFLCPSVCDLRLSHPFSSFFPSKAYWGSLITRSTNVQSSFNLQCLFCLFQADYAFVLIQRYLQIQVGNKRGR